MRKVLGNPAYRLAQNAVPRGDGRTTSPLQPGAIVSSSTNSLSTKWKTGSVKTQERSAALDVPPGLNLLGSAVMRGHRRSRTSRFENYVMVWGQVAARQLLPRGGHRGTANRDLDDP